MHLEYLLYGLTAGIIGPLVAIPPLILGMHLLLKRGSRYCFAYGMGNSTAQFIWATVAGFAMYSGGIFASEGRWLSFIAPVILFVMAYKFYRVKPGKPKHEVEALENSLWKDYLLGFTLSSTAPQRALLYFAIFSAFGVHYSVYNFSTFEAQLPLIFGVVIASVIFWCLYTLLLSKVAKKMSEKQILWFNRIGATIILLLGVSALIGALTST